MASELRATVGGEIIKHSKVEYLMMDVDSSQVWIVEAGSGMDLGKRMKTSIIIKKYFMPMDSSRGFTK